MVAPIIKLALDQTHQTLRKTPEQYGYLANTNGKLKLVESVCVYAEYMKLQTNIDQPYIISNPVIMISDHPCISIQLYKKKIFCFVWFEFGFVDATHTMNNQNEK